MIEHAHIKRKITPCVLCIFYLMSQSDYLKPWHSGTCATEGLSLIQPSSCTTWSEEWHADVQKPSYDVISAGFLRFIDFLSYFLPFLIHFSPLFSQHKYFVLIQPLSNFRFGEIPWSCNPPPCWSAFAIPQLIPYSLNVRLRKVFHLDQLISLPVDWQSWIPATHNGDDNTANTIILILPLATLVRQSWCGCLFQYSPLKSDLDNQQPFLSHKGCQRNNSRINSLRPTRTLNKL